MLVTPGGIHGPRGGKPIIIFQEEPPPSRALHANESINKGMGAASTTNMGGMFSDGTKGGIPEKNLAGTPHLDRHPPVQRLCPPWGSGKRIYGYQGGGYSFLTRGRYGPIGGTRGIAQTGAQWE